MPSNSHVSDIVYRAVGLMSGWIEVIMLNSLNVRYDKVFLISLHYVINSNAKIDGKMIYQNICGYI